MKRVAMLLFPGVQALDVSGPLDVFAEANAFVPAGQGYQVITLAAPPLPLRASNGQLLGADFNLEQGHSAADILLVPGGPTLPEESPASELLDWLRSACALAPRYGSICTGAFLLGHAGLLDGKRVTTHWSDARRLAELFPQAQVEPDRIHVRDGALVTSAGVTAGIDLALALVAEDHGAAVALSVAKRLLVVAQRQGGQSQFSPFLQAPADEGSPVARIQRYVQENLDQPLGVPQLATEVAMSPRSFARVFVREAGVTPAEFVQRARIDAARGLLEGGDLALKVVAWRCGFGSAARMRLVFTQRLGVTPTQYREQFRRDG
ncbi:GlxA family transcriptional regulator [Pseudomonas nicosulfuronedens]|uniref:GlxA family transcriptional regulator n=1 Tax=Pseudomonas nicosulfuronedens TaxID=2571105 RepID=A0A5R9R009_9PSED|nr:GlxA family transcriptional regulator [Pseudomonas nicosulfuronedens]MDH1011814.1 GlxA family transcriptional regulator [Pseudomonas nicosulfuronedens]MDH1980693.1 GlxA family transcriptional regulator [Pseudomonas nicosulfuronedens]MDH2030260.1 GlxA family transcriptional regulator [Pseudomonas nicosulfuronedens]TLX75875.1 GlxA family transcriptional regulator [Pseudomonas nicosulfuronedens]